MSLKKSLKRDKLFWDKIKGGEKMFGQKRGQSTLEYILILTAIIAAIILVASKVQQKVESSLEHASNQTEIQVRRIHFGNATAPQEPEG